MLAVSIFVKFCKNLGFLLILSPLGYKIIVIVIDLVIIHSIPNTINYSPPSHGKGQREILHLSIIIIN